MQAFRWQHPFCTNLGSFCVAKDGITACFACEHYHDFGESLHVTVNSAGILHTGLDRFSY